MRLVSKDLGGIYIIDGGFSTQLAKYVGATVDGDPLWSARFNYTDPGSVVQTHLDFLKAGADVLITNTYQASIDGYVKYLGLTPTEARQLIIDTVGLARKACDIYARENPDCDRQPLVVGSVGSYGAHLHDGSEYTGDYVDKVKRKDIADWHRPSIEALVTAGVDALAIETIPCQMEGEVLVDLIKSEFPGTKAWLSFQCKVNTQDEVLLARGDDFSTAALSCWERSGGSGGCLIAVGVNCLNPKYVASLIESLNGSRCPKIPVVVYPNSGETYTTTEGWTEREKCEPIETYVTSWLDKGVVFVGGCCRTDAKDVASIRREVIKYLNHDNSIAITNGNHKPKQNGVCKHAI